jgi:hypothetical protein
MQYCLLQAIFEECQNDMKSFMIEMEKYYSKIEAKDSKGAIFLAVCKGKVRKIIFSFLHLNC